MAATRVDHYELEDVPASARSSRFLLTTGPNGASVHDPTLILALAYGQLAEKRACEQPPYEPETVTVPIFKVVETPEGWELVLRGEVTGPVTRKSTRKSKFEKRELPLNGVALDSFLLGESGWENLTDREVWTALKNLLEAERIRGEERRRITNSVTSAILARAGLIVKTDQLPAY